MQKRHNSIGPLPHEKIQITIFPFPVIYNHEISWQGYYLHVFKKWRRCNPLYIFSQSFFWFFFSVVVYILYVILQLNVYFLVGGSVLCMNNTCVCVHIYVVSMIWLRNLSSRRKIRLINLMDRIRQCAITTKNKINVFQKNRHTDIEKAAIAWVKVWNLQKLIIFCSFKNLLYSRTKDSHGYWLKN